jgi:TPR repeat protein
LIAVVLAVAMVLGMVTAPAWADYQDGLRAYQHGDYAAAYREWLPLAEQGDAAAQASLGGLYVNGQGVTKDDTEALKWLRLAAEQGNAIAQNNLGFMYGNGRGVPRDDAQAVEWYRRSADQGNAFGQAVLGRMYMEGRGVPKDPVLAYMWYSLAIKKQPVLEWALKGREKVAVELSP